MTTTTTTTDQPCTDAIIPGLALPCPHCHEQTAGVRLHLSSGVFACDECEEEISAADIEAAIAALSKWRKVFAWAASMPTSDE